ncbi:glycosyltransferase family 9 protein [Bdellovibrio svalbardensis]|uniref:Glycosyltransferase family 9 protein n=1 Tax=Bdellovibrio svalbardensis TaxID=2972972 RepID=A0ABT6DNW4_9BACT|nr:glycosyltransferase family 9 protein [Bdellovibrio svalbardensis]MDG0817531.1 glycosyltransferase family 9 protein [Bdellovibrio svalbardensis]
MPVSDCRHFSGYKPCKKNEFCDSSCAHKDIPQISLLVVHLGALGAVVRSTSLLRAIKRKYPSSMVTWVTDAPAHQLLHNHPAIDRVLTTTEADLLQLSTLEFEVALVIDKSLKAVGVLKRTTVDQIFGFTVNPRNGAIVPATAAANELWQLGLNDEKKFFENTKAETQLMVEALELGPFQRDEYWLPLNKQEDLTRQARRSEWLQGKSLIIGLNTGCSNVIAHKKLTVEYHRILIQKLSHEIPDAQLVLLGGPEDTERNVLIATGLPVISSETRSGLRDGLVSVAACDIVITGDSLGMHMAISQQKQVIAWFGPTCAHEIDIYERGAKILTKSPCAPCWKRACEKDIMCYDQVSLMEILDAVKSSRTNCLSRGSAAVDPAIEAL